MGGKVRERIGRQSWGSRGREEHTQVMHGPRHRLARGENVRMGVPHTYYFRHVHKYKVWAKSGVAEVK